MRRAQSHGARTVGQRLHPLAQRRRVIEKRLLAALTPARQDAHRPLQVGNDPETPKGKLGSPVVVLGRGEHVGEALVRLGHLVDLE